MEKNYDVVALGELLIDFTENGISSQGNPLLEANPGGAPCNVLALLSKLGHKTAFIGKVGKDIFGSQLREAIEEVGIESKSLMVDESVNTTLAFVHTYPDGDREFSFYRNPGADMMLSKEDLDFDLLSDTKIFHFGTLSMTHEFCEEATKEAVRAAKEKGALISFDPNLREVLWDDLDRAKEMMDYGFSNCDILKIADNEILWYTGEKDFDSAVKLMLEKYSIKLLLLSKGKDGSVAYYDGMCVEKEAYVQKNTIETTGAGDTFMGSVLHFVLEHGLDGLKESDLLEMLSFANAAAALVTTKKGALRVMPTKEEIRNLKR